MSAPDIYGHGERRHITYLWLVTVTRADGTTDQYLATGAVQRVAEQHVLKHCGPGSRVDFSELICGSDRDVNPRRTV